MKKELYINHNIPQIEVDESKNIPTVILYDSRGKGIIGSSALAAAQSQQKTHEVIREFKIPLGFVEPLSPTKSSPERKMFFLASGEGKSAAAVTSDFLIEILRHVNKWLDIHGIGKGAKILLAEPLSMEGK